jgi:hypothetical protein
MFHHSRKSYASKYQPRMPSTTSAKHTSVHQSVSVKLNLHLLRILLSLHRLFPSLRLPCRLSSRFVTQPGLQCPAGAFLPAQSWCKQGKAYSAVVFLGTGVLLSLHVGPRGFSIGFSGSLGLQRAPFLRALLHSEICEFHPHGT